eukprot:5632523-Prymnesium_polylepis.1
MGVGARSGVWACHMHTARCVCALARWRPTEPRLGRCKADGRVCGARHACAAWRAACLCGLFGPCARGSQCGSAQTPCRGLVA